MRRFNWAGVDIDVTVEPKTSDWWEWVSAVSMSDKVSQVSKFVEPFLSVGLPTIIEGCVSASPVDLAEKMFSACVPDGLSTCLSFVYGADKLDRKKIKKVCACQACSGLSDDSSDCRFEAAGVDVWTRRVANQEPELLASMWSLPYSVYALACEQRRAAREGTLASQYPVESERRKKTHEDAIARLRKYHGHA